MPLLSFPVLAGAALAVLVGISLGMLGGGGSILMVPILVYVVGAPPHDAIALSLLVVGTTSLAALVPHARAGRVRWRTGVLFGATSMLGAFGAGMLAEHVPATLLILLFGVIMLVTALAMMRGRASPETDDAPACEAPLSELPIARIVLQGLVVGSITGLVGAGGGFLVVPALLMFGKLPMRAAVGTSLLVISMNSLAGFAGHVQSAHVDPGVAVLVTTAAVLGSFVGGALAGRVTQDRLRRGFAWLVLAMAAFVLLQEIPRALAS